MKIKLAKAKLIPRQSSILISGTIQKTKSKDFEVEVLTKDIHVYSEAKQSSPIDPTGRIESNLDNRLDSRALDLRNPKVSKIFLLRSNVLEIMRNYFIKKNFIEVNTPKIIGSASEGGSNLFSFDYFKRKGYLVKVHSYIKNNLYYHLIGYLKLSPIFEQKILIL